MAEYQEDLFEDEFGEDERPGQRPVLSESDLFDRLVELNKQINTAKADIAQVIVDCKYHKKSNPGGHDTNRVKYIAKSAVTYAAGDYEEKKTDALTFFQQFEEITKYND